MMRILITQHYDQTPGKFSFMGQKLGRALIFAALTLVGQLGQAQDFVYQPINPAFGGSNFNYSWMLSAAQVQNDFQDPGIDFMQDDPLADFEESINRQILSRISREIIGDQFGEEGLQEGQYTIGNYQIDVSPGDNGIQVNILDTGSGSETRVTVPYF